MRTVNRVSDLENQATQMTRLFNELDEVLSGLHQRIANVEAKRDG